MIIERTANIPESHRLTIEVRPEVPAGPVTLTIMTKEAAEPDRQKGRVFGCAKGRGEYWMAEDFDAPLDDFKDYM
jgi:hypothetical protein